MNQSTEQQVKFNEFLKSLSAYYMDFLETDFKKRRLPCRRIVYRREDLLVGTPLYKYEKLRKQLFDAIWDGFHSKRSIEVVRGRFAIKLSDDIKDAILDAVDSIDQKNFNLREFIRTVDIASGKSIPNKELFLKELEFQVEDLLKENSGTLDKEQVEEIFDSCYYYYYTDCSWVLITRQSCVVSYTLELW